MFLVRSCNQYILLVLLRKTVMVETSSEKNQHNCLAVGLLNLIFVFLFYFVQIAPTVGNGIALLVSLPISFIQWQRESEHQTKDEQYSCTTLTLFLNSFFPRPSRYCMTSLLVSVTYQGRSYVHAL